MTKYVKQLRTIMTFSIVLPIDACYGNNKVDSFQSEASFGEFTPKRLKPDPGNFRLNRKKSRTSNQKAVFYRIIQVIEKGLNQNKH